MTSVINSVTGNCIRFIPAEDCVEKEFSERWRYEREREALGLLQFQRPFVPHMLDGGTMAGERPVLRLELIQGDSLQNHLARSSADTHAISCALGRLIKRVHAVRFANSAGDTTLPLRNAAHFRRIFDGTDLENSAKASAFSSLLDGNEEFVDENNFALLHRDISLTNLMVRNGSDELVLLDFENAAWGHPHADVWRLLEVENPGNAELSAAFRSTYFDDRQWESYQRSGPFMRTAFALEMMELYLQRKITLTPEMHNFIAGEVDAFGIALH